MQNWRHCCQICLVAIVLLGFTLGQPARAQTCNLPPVMSSLVTMTERALANPVDGRWALAQVLATTTERQIVVDLQSVGLGDTLPLALELFDHAVRLAERPATADFAAIARLLESLEYRVAESCSPVDVTGFQAIQKERLGGIELTDDLTEEEVTRILGESDAVGIGLMTALLAVLIVVVYAVDSMFRWLMAFIYNRKSCRIPASLLVGDTTLEGNVITLGRGGCRFAPFDPDFFEQVAPDLKSGGAVLSLRDGSFTTETGAIYLAHVDLRFEKPLTVAAQSVLLEASTITPFYVRKTRPAPPDSDNLRARRRADSDKNSLRAIQDP